MSINIQTLSAISTTNNGQLEEIDLSSEETLINTPSPSNTGCLKTMAKQHFFSKTVFPEKSPSGMHQATKSSVQLPPLLLPKNIAAKFFPGEKLPQKQLDSFEKTFFPRPYSQSSSGETIKSNKQFSPFEKGSSEKTFAQKNIHIDVTATQKKGESVTSRSKESHCNTLQSHRWTSKETLPWWNERYHEKEKEGRGQDQRDDREKNEEKKSGKIMAFSPRASSERGFFSTPNLEKPVLQPPKLGVFALYYILTKMGLFSDGISNFSYRKEIGLVDEETTITHKKRIACLKEAMEKEQSASRWDIASKAYSWIASLMGIVTGAILIATGVGTVAGALLIVGGVFQLTNQILEITGAWHKISEILPGKDITQKRALISWMQIGITVLTVILAGVGAVWGGGFTLVQEGMSFAMYAMGGVATIGHGVATIGAGIVMFLFKEKMSEHHLHEMKLAQLKHDRQDLMEKIETGVDRLEQLFENLIKALEFEDELFQADQSVNH